MSHFYIKTVILPRPARDKYRESTQKRDRFLIGHRSNQQCLRRLRRRGVRPPRGAFIYCPHQTNPLCRAYFLHSASASSVLSYCWGGVSNVVWCGAAWRLFCLPASSSSSSSSASGWRPCQQTGGARSVPQRRKGLE